MAAKSAPVAAPSAAELDRVIAALVASRGVKAERPSISAFLADKLADSGRGVARIGAGLSAATENAALAFEAERNRQTRRTAQSILAAAHAA